MDGFQIHTLKTHGASLRQLCTVSFKIAESIWVQNWICQLLSKNNETFKKDKILNFFPCQSFTFVDLCTC